MLATTIRTGPVLRIYLPIAALAVAVMFGVVTAVYFGIAGSGLLRFGMAGQGIFIAWEASIRLLRRL